MTSLSMITPSFDDEASSFVPRMPASAVADRLIVMRRQEETTYRCADYLSQQQEERLKRTVPQQVQNASQIVDEECRVKMCEWCYQVNDFCKFRRETVGIGMSYLDRYLATHTGRAALSNRKDYQLAAMTTLYMAIKLFEPLEMETSLLSDLSRGCYTEAEIADMEQSILMALEWRVHGPTPLGFIQHFVALIPEGSISPDVAAAILDFSRYQTELAVADYFFVPRNQSSIALGSILNAMEGMDRSILPQAVRDVFLRNVAAAASITAMTPEVIAVREVLRASFVASTGGYDIVAAAMARLGASAFVMSDDADEDETMAEASDGDGGGRRESGTSSERKMISRRDMMESPVCVTRK